VYASAKSRAESPLSVRRTAATLLRTLFRITTKFPEKNQAIVVCSGVWLLSQGFHLVVFLRVQAARQGRRPRLVQQALPVFLHERRHVADPRSCHRRRGAPLARLGFSREDPDRVDEPEIGAKGIWIFDNNWARPRDLAQADRGQGGAGRGDLRSPRAREARRDALLLRGADATRDRRGAGRHRVARLAAAHERSSWRGPASRPRHREGPPERAFSP